MDLSEFFRTRPELQVLDAERDRAEVLELFARSPMHVAGLELVYDRSPDFSRLLECQGHDFVSFAGHHHGRKCFLASVSLERRWVDGRPANVAYVGDFRTDGSRAAALLWRREYRNLIAALKALPERPEVILTTILGGNAEALRNLAEPRRTFGVRYDEVAELEMVNTYARWPWARSSNVVTEPARPEDETELRHFLFEREKTRPFGLVIDDELWARRARTWPGFRTENFLVQRNARGNLVACTLPWDPGFAKRMTVRRAPVTLRAAFAGLRGLGWPLPRVGESLSALYLTHLNFADEADRGLSLKSFVEHARRGHPRAHFVSFAADAESAGPMRGWIQQRVPVRLFTVSDESKVAEPPVARTPSFEMGLV